MLSPALAGREDQQATLAELFAGRLRIGSALPWGGLALVHRATPLEAAAGTRFTLAVLPVDCESDPARAERLRALGDAAKAVTHPGLLPLMSFGVQLGVPFFVYEHLEAETLEERLARGSLPAEEARALGRALLGALGAAHAAGLHHLDLTPANVLVAEGRLLLLGLGIARLVREVSPDKTGPTGRGSGVDARRFLAPEILRGERGGAQSDVYSVGALLHRAVVGVAPGRPPVPGALLAYDASPGLREVVERALTMEPEGRFASADEMAAALEATRATPISSVPPPRGEPLVAPARDPDRAGLPTGLLLAGALVVLVAALVAMGLFGAGADAEEPPAPPAPAGPASPESSGDAEGPGPDTPATENTAPEPPPRAGDGAGSGDGPGEAAAAGEPLAGELPAALADALDRIEAGERFEAPSAFDPLYGYTRRSPEDPRGYLVLARAFMARGYRSAAFSRYGYAFRLDAALARRDPHVLPDLVDVAARASDPGIEGRVLRLLRTHYGPRALPAVDAALDAESRRGVRQRLMRLRTVLERPPERGSAP